MLFTSLLFEEIKRIVEEKERELLLKLQNQSENQSKEIDELLKKFHQVETVKQKVNELSLKNSSPLILSKTDVVDNKIDQNNDVPVLGNNEAKKEE